MAPTWLGADPSNFTVGRDGHSVTEIVLHTMVGTIASAAARFNTPNQASAHYGVGLDGRLVQFVAEGDTAYHAGNWDVNLTSIGIEHEDDGDYAGPRTDALYAASAALVADLCQRYGLGTPGAGFIRRHSDVSTEGTACPDALDTDRIIRQAAAILAPPPAPAPPVHRRHQEEAQMITTVIPPKQTRTVPGLHVGNLFGQLTDSVLVAVTGAGGDSPVILAVDKQADGRFYDHGLTAPAAGQAALYLHLDGLFPWRAETFEFALHIVNAGDHEVTATVKQVPVG